MLLRAGTSFLDRQASIHMGMHQQNVGQHQGAEEPTGYVLFANGSEASLAFATQVWWA